MHNSSTGNPIVKECPLCRTTFTCLAGNIEYCQCNTVTITPVQRDALQKQVNDCVCLACLTKQEHDLTKFTKRKKADLVENVDYYLEGPYFVFTAHHHLQRGYCCKNNCRHCPYGFTK